MPWQVTREAYGQSLPRDDSRTFGGGWRSWWNHRAAAAFAIHRPQGAQGSMNLDFALLAPSVKVNQGEGRSLARVGWFHGDHVLVVFCADFEFDNGTGVLLARQFFVLVFIIVIAVFRVVVYVDTAAMLLRMALEDFAEFLQLSTIKVDDPGRWII